MKHPGVNHRTRECTAVHSPPTTCGVVCGCTWGVAHGVPKLLAITTHSRSSSVRSWCRAEWEENAAARFEKQQFPPVTPFGSGQLKLACDNEGPILDRIGETFDYKLAGSRRRRTLFTNRVIDRALQWQSSSRKNIWYERHALSCDFFSLVRSKTLSTNFLTITLTVLPAALLRPIGFVPWVPSDDFVAGVDRGGRAFGWWRSQHTWGYPLLVRQTRWLVLPVDRRCAKGPTGQWKIHTQQGETDTKQIGARVTCIRVFLRKGGDVVAKGRGYF